MSKVTRKRRGQKLDEDDEAEVEPKTKSVRSTAPKIKTIKVKGRAPVDEKCPVKDTVHVYSAGDDVYDVMLNQTNVQNNNNKYYAIQLVEDDNNKSYYVWQRWGRVGYDGQNKLERCGSDLEKAKHVFCKKFSDKTGNEWSDRANFEKLDGKYDFLEIDYEAKSKDEEKAVEVSKEIKPPPPSKLDATIQELLKMICDVRAMEEAVKEMQYDASKAPLGKLTEAQIKAGYAALKKIETCVQKKDFGRNLVEACNEFYTRIPHYFGMKTPPLIRDHVEIKQKIELLEALNDIEVAIRTLAGEDVNEKSNPLDRHYESMKCELLPIERESERFELLRKYLTVTHGATHNLYTMELLDVFECRKDGEDTSFDDVGNKMLLWHGSRLTNWYGILSQGLRIAPPEAPVTGYMFGKGVYFADVSSKSANYCFTTRDKNIGLLVLCEVSLGKTRDLVNADYKADKLPAGFHSTKGSGRIEPDKSEYVKIDDCVVPCGKPIDANRGNTTLQYNEYVVYNTRRVKMRYLLKVKFVY